MSMTLGGGPNRLRADINITPMIDVLLVLIIIFMVITPTVSRGLETQVPQDAPAGSPERASSRDLVITISKDHEIALNQQPVSLSGLRDRLAALYGHGAYQIFVRGDRELEFKSVVDVIDIARGVGWDRVGLMTK